MRPAGNFRGAVIWSWSAASDCPFEKEADARLEWTRDLERADFFIAPTHMNCDRLLGGRVVATVERLGVVIGVVKDRRAVMARASPEYAVEGEPVWSAIP